jgi:cytochrome c5
MRNNRLLLALSLIGIGLVGISITSRLCPSCAPVSMMQMMRGVMGPGTTDHNQMKEMMQQMMGGILPPGIKPEDLPDPHSPGARLIATYCNQCHALPSPRMHRAEDWPRIVGRMVARARMMSGMQGMMMQVKAPTSGEEKVLLQYLQSHSMRGLSALAIPSPKSPGAMLFQQVCSQCHALPDPTLHTADEWPAVVARMRQSMAVMGKARISEQEEDEIIGFLGMNSRK